MSQHELTVRRLGTDETEVLKHIWLEALQVEPAVFASSIEDYQAATDDVWRRSEDDPVFAAFQGAEPVGIMGLTRLRGRKMNHRARIGMVYLRAALRGTGLAARLLDEVTAHARSQGVRQLELVVSAENPAAIRFYQRDGYIEVGRVPAGFVHDGREIDDILMVRRLEE